MERDAHIRVKGLYKVFGDERAIALAKDGRTRAQIKKETGAVLALKNINLEVPRGEISVVMGLSGSGKSTLIRCLNRLIEPTSGEITIAGADVRRLSRKDLRRLRREETAMVFQHFGLLPNRTVLENVMLGLELRGEKNLAPAREALKTVGLEEWTHSKPDELSGGMQQRVGLARALATRASTLLMDEPFSALDPLIRARLQDELLKLQDEIKKTIIFITHDLDEALKLGSRIAILDEEGAIVQQGTPEEIVLKPKTSFVQAFVKNIDKQTVIRAESIMQKTPRGFKKTRGRTIRHYETIHNAIPQLLKNNKPIAVLDKNDKTIGVLTRAAINKVLGETR